MSVILETSIGDITVDLYTDERPRCCTNFLKLCKTKYYNFSLFHTVTRNLIAQTGDPTATGRGGDSVYAKLYGDQARFFEMELKPKIKHTKFGTLSMVNNGNDMHGSQFFITLSKDIDHLNGKHTVFGEVAEGFDVLQKFNETYVDKEGRPFQDIRILHTVILEDPFDDPSELSGFIPERSPSPTPEMLKSDRIAVGEKIDDFEGMAPEEIEEVVQDKHAKANAQILEIIGDLPDADVKPPDNVLFVCKLNPVTTDEDLEIIFSRFGPIKSCEVIREKKTLESLQYAFIEFEKEEDCESAYFKMDNVQIDERRIHVDFSQSVAKVKWKGKGKGVEIVEPDKDAGFTSAGYRIRDNSRKTKYEMVFEEDEAKHRSSTSKKKKRRSIDPGDQPRSHKKESRRRSRSHSPRHKREERRRRRSNSRERRDHSSSRDRHRKSRREDRRSRSRDRHR
ncbi:hypothetical protein CAPTEDRAFT_152742 [Capitella teleta]|uniref:Peptidyl-prolyl cis-trans isomerase n=1 Tax=Capitella teleta TaxID=283909 RepID=R7UYX8_CAPTE|nr:hypothetical protein CAPTEDRAFT_152742 [Capitella teleta]|eukprot:ELU11487.1 hypothetical protein CAPTEDRAFT_152742 [Capitella teleta]